MIYILNIFQIIRVLEKEKITKTNNPFKILSQLNLK